jgi:hypothetical protein
MPDVNQNFHSTFNEPIAACIRKGRWSEISSTLFSADLEVRTTSRGADRLSLMLVASRQEVLDGSGGLDSFPGGIS